jgi:hypothetical protein
MGGQAIYKRQYQLRKGMNLLTLDMGNWSKGVYIINMTTDTGERNSIKVVKQ